MNATIHVIGAGGIGSYLLRDLAKLERTNQLVGMNGTVYSIIVYDEDDVEQKNLLYQDYSDDDVLEPKAEVLGNRHNIGYMEIFVKNLNDIVSNSNDIIVCCVDNAEFRRHLFEWQQDHPNFWVDLRSHGRMIVRLSRSEQNDMDYLLGSLPQEEEDGGGSCQRAVDLEKGIIQMGNRIIATIGCQTILNHLRGVTQDSRFYRQF